MPRLFLSAFVHTCIVTFSVVSVSAAEPQWRHLSTLNGDLPLPGSASEQTGAVVGDFDRDGTNDFIISTRKVAPAVLWYRRTASAWERYVVEPEMLRVEAGGAVFDIDGDGDPDLVFGGDGSSDQLWWWENPYPNFDPKAGWKRRIIKQGGGKAHHDQVFADLKGTGRPQLVFWNQRVEKLFLADIPANPSDTGPWPQVEIFDASKIATTNKQEGMDVADVDGDGRVDLLAGMFWFKHIKGNEFKAIQVCDRPGRIAAGKFKPGKHSQIISAPGDGIGPLRLYECAGDPEKTADWVGRDLAGRDMVHGHSLAVADIDGDGRLDIFAAEMAQWTSGKEANNPDATAWIFYGDGQGGFRKTVFKTGFGFHEARVADLDGDGRIDILSKPYIWQTPRVDIWLQGAPGKTAAAASADAPGGTERAIGFQLYSFRAEMAQDIPGTLAKVRALGITDVELPNLFGKTAAEFRAELDRAGLVCTSFLTTYEQLASGLDAVAANAKTLGAKFVVCGRIPHQRSPTNIFTIEQAEKAAKDFNEWGARLRAQGLQFCYHPHGFEFRALGAGTVFDRLAQLTDPGDVKFELDVFWVIYPGRDPVALLKKYPGRFPLMHLKDLRRGVTGNHSGRAPHDTNVALGEGQADWPAILQAAREANVQHYYIEDESPDPLRQAQASVRYLSPLFRK